MFFQQIQMFTLLFAFFHFATVSCNYKSRTRTYVLITTNPFNASRARRESVEETGELRTTVSNSGASPADPCLLKCKDDYMFFTQSTTSNQQEPAVPSWRMDNAIGSPLHALIETVSSDNSLERIAMECNHHETFLVCLERCPTSAARQILADGQEAMKTVCHGYKKDKEFLHFVLPCLAKNGQKIGKTCRLHWSLMENDIYEAIQSRLILGQEPIVDARLEEEEEEDGFLRLCRAITSYSDCHLRTIGQLCHRRAIPFFVRLNQKSSGALLKMLLDWSGREGVDADWLECEHWDPAKLLRPETNGIEAKQQQMSLLAMFSTVFLLYNFH